MSRVLVFEDAFVRRYEVRDAAGQLVGLDEESKLPPEPACPGCGRPF